MWALDRLLCTPYKHELIWVLSSVFRRLRQIWLDFTCLKNTVLILRMFFYPSHEFGFKYVILKLVSLNLATQLVLSIWQIWELSERQDFGHLYGGRSWLGWLNCDNPPHHCGSHHSLPVILGYVNGEGEQTSITPCFLVTNMMWAAASCSHSLDISAMMDHILGLRARQKPFSIKLLLLEYFITVAEEKLRQNFLNYCFVLWYWGLNQNLACAYFTTELYPQEWFVASSYRYTPFVSWNTPHLSLTLADFIHIISPETR